MKAAETYEAGSKAFNSKDFEGARVLFDKALAGGLNGDQVGTARCKRAICLAISGDFPGAFQELEDLAAAAPNLDEVFAAKSYVLSKQGKVAEAQAAWAQAVRYNRNVKKLVN